jgi:hypothetical protein
MTRSEDFNLEFDATADTDAQGRRERDQNRRHIAVDGTRLARETSTIAAGTEFLVRQDGSASALKVETTWP